ncbi:MAG: hypothetical protein DMG44_07195 [Acidobacteria bacterium]|jgi:hypothetical protein|nr:MAG: hypothetical protein DMG44_07195 [Acidobacteriota bacterium]
MNSKNLWRRVLGSVLTLSDLVVAIFAFFGGMNMFNINVPAAVGTLLGGTIVLVLSIGLWTGNRYMQITRIAIYLCGLVVAALSFSVIGLAKGISAVWPMPVILVLFLFVCCLSFLQLRLWQRNEA